MKTHLDSIKTDLSSQSTYDEINNFRKDKFNSFSSSIKSILDSVSDPTTGLIAQLECSKYDGLLLIVAFIEWIGLRWEDFNTSFCDSTVPNFSLIGVALLLSAVLNVFVVCCGGCLAIRIRADIKR